MQDFVVPYLLRVFLRWIARYKDRRSNYTEDERLRDIPNTKKLTQKDLEEVHKNPEFDVSTRYVYFSITMTIAMTFSSTVFCMYPCACACFGLKYMNDKYLMLNFHPKTSSFDERLHISNYIVYVYASAFTHLAIAIYAFGNFNMQMKDVLQLDGTNSRIFFWVYVGILTFMTMVRCGVVCKDLVEKITFELTRLMSEDTDKNPHKAPCNNIFAEINVRGLGGYYKRYMDELAYAQKYDLGLKDKSEKEEN